MAGPPCYRPTVVLHPFAPAITCAGPAWDPATHKEGEVYRRILVPLDGSELAETAIPHAELLASTTGAHLELIRVTVLRFLQAPDGHGYTVKQEGDREEAEGYLQEWRQRLSGKGVQVSCQVRGGNVAEEIVEQAAATKADIVVMSSHGRTGARLWAYGSVAEKVLRAAPCSVLVVRARPGDITTQ